MKKIRNLLGALALSMSSAAMATAVTPNAGWYGFCFGGAGSGATAGCQNAGVDVAGNTMTFTLSAPALLKVTDAFLIGDIFDVFINSIFAFTTSAPGTGAETIDPDVAFTSGYYSAGSILLGAGSYDVDIFVNSTPFAGGGAYVEVESIRAQIPIPGTLLLLGIGLAGLGFVRRKTA